MRRLELVILSVLRDHGGNPQSAAQLFIAVNQESPISATTSDIAARLAALDKDGHVFGAGTADGIKYTITVAGKARLAEANL